MRLRSFAVWRTLPAVFFALLLTCLGLQAQTAVDGAIGGTVVDATGAVVSGAAVSARNTGTNAEQKTVTDATGYFRVLHLQPGVYNVTIEAPGFSTFRSVNTQVLVGVMTDVQAHLAIGNASQVVEVTDAAPLVNTTSPDFAGVVEQITLHSLPENNYRWSAFALLTPGVVNDANGYGLLSFRGQSTLLNNITIDGTDDNQAYFSEERGRTRAGYSTIKDAVQEFQVNTSNYSVEYGRSAGGIVNSVTKSGTNKFHGGAYYFDRDSDWNATNSYVTHVVQDPTTKKYSSVAFKPTDLRRQMGFNVGGPILRDKVFFFVAYDRYYHDFPGVAAMSPSASNNFFATPDAALPTGKTCTGTGSAAPSFADANVCRVATDTGLSYTNALTVYNNGITGLTSLLGTTPRTGDQTIFFPKVDWQINQKNHFSVEANRMRWTSPAGIQTAPSVAYGTSSFGNDYVRDNWLVSKLDTYFTPALSNEIRFMYGRDFEFETNQTPTSYEMSNLVNTPSGYANSLGLPPNIYLNGFFQFGTPQFLNRAALPDEYRWQIADTVSWVRGNHTFKFGVDFLHTDDNISNLYNQFGGYTYQSTNAAGTSVALADYISDLYLSQNAVSGKTAKNYNYFNQGAGPAGLDFTTLDSALFAQDEWKVSPRLSLTLGLRWEFEKMPDQQLPNADIPQSKSLPENKANIGPRVGFAYDVYGHGSTILRGGYGMFFARAINSTIYQALISSGSTGGQTNPNLYPSTSGACAPVFPQVDAASCLGGTSGNTTAYYLNSNFKVPQIHMADLTVEQQLGKSDVISVSGLGSWGRRLPNFRDVNLPAPVAITYTISDASGVGILPNGTSFATNGYFGARPNTKYSTITDIYSGVNSSYYALVGTIKHRLSHHISADANYTWSHAMDSGENNTTGASANAPLDTNDLTLEHGNSNQNVPNRMVVHMVGQSPWKFKGPLSYLLNDYEIAPSFQVQNGMPYSAGLTSSVSALYLDNATATTKLTNSSAFNGSKGAARLPILDRNSYQAPKTWNVDLRLSKAITVQERYKLEFLAEAFNLTNHQNVTSVASTAYSVSTNSTTHQNLLVPYTSTPFSTITATNNSNFAYNVRQLQLAVRLNF